MVGETVQHASRRKFLMGAGAACSSALAGCSALGVGEGDGDGNSEFSGEVTVTHWPLLMYAPPYQMAAENGYFEEESINIKGFVGSSGGGTTVRNVATGGLPFGEVATPAAVNAYYAGAPITIIGSATNTPGTLNWVTPKGSDIESVQDLRGETVGFTSAGSVTQNTAALSFNRADGISVDDVELSAMGGVSEGLTAVESGDIAAAANLDPVFSSQQQADDRWDVVFWASDFIEQFQQTCIIAGPDVLENNPDAVEGYLRARARGVQFIRENPEESAEIFASYNDGYDTATMQSALENVAPDTYYTENGFNVDGLQVIEEGMRNIDLIDREVGWTDIIDQSYLPEDKQTDLSALGE